MKKVLLVVATVLLMVGCSNDKRRAEAEPNKPQSYRVKLYSGSGLAIWITDGEVHKMTGGTYMFVDSRTGKWVRIQGDISIEEI